MNGAKQGSVLGLLLFTIYVYNICDQVTHSKALMFADDLNNFYSFKSALRSIIDTNINRNISSIFGQILVLADCHFMCRYMMGPDGQRLPSSSDARNYAFFILFL